MASLELTGGREVVTEIIRRAFLMQKDLKSIHYFNFGYHCDGLRSVAAVATAKNAVVFGSEDASLELCRVGLSIRIQR